MAKDNALADESYVYLQQRRMGPDTYAAVAECISCGAGGAMFTAVSSTAKNVDRMIRSKARKHYHKVHCACCD
jgi:hypothetical protein